MKKNDAEDAGKFLSKMGIYSILYGLFSINYIDFVIAGPTIVGYHIWLTIAYFSLFIPLILIFGFEDWELVGALGLTASLMNDAFYYPIGRLMLGITVNLSEWYAFQLGFKGFEVWWNFNAGFVTVPVSSLLMGLTIHARIGIVGALIYRWWHCKRICHKPPANLTTVED